MDIKNLLTFAVAQSASDLHLSVGLPPKIRVDGDLHNTSWPPVTSQDLSHLLSELMNETQFRAFEALQEMDFSHEIKNLARFRVHAFRQASGLALVFRIIPWEITSLEALKLPALVSEFVQYPQGLVLVTGPTGSGKSTTLAALVDRINTTRPLHILSIEDPIEFVHVSKQSLISQREVHRHTKGFAEALRAGLRADPDIIMLGELRDLETIRLAITAAETGHLVLASLHTQSASSTIHRIIDVFPGSEQSLIRTMLSESLQAVIAQKLVKKMGGGRVVACEIMRSSPAIKHLIREHKVAQIYATIQTSQAKGMQTMDQALCALVAKGIICPESVRSLD